MTVVEPTEEEQKQVQHVFEFVSEGIKHIMAREVGSEELKDLTRNLSWH